MRNISNFLVQGNTALRLGWPVRACVKITDALKLFKLNFILVTTLFRFSSNMMPTLLTSIRLDSVLKSNDIISVQLCLWGPNCVLLHGWWEAL